MREDCQDYSSSIVPKAVPLFQRFLSHKSVGQTLRAFLPRILVVLLEYTFFDIYRLSRWNPLRSGAAQSHELDACECQPISGICK